MPSPDKFKNLQKLFFSKVTSCCNPSRVTLKFITVTSSGQISDFTGDSDRTVEKSVELGCFYLRSISEKQRDRLGVGQDVTDIVYISPLELEAKYGSILFPDYIRNAYSNLAVLFIGGYYEVVSIQDLEPMFDGKQYVALCYQLNLKKSTGVRNFN